MNKITSYKIMQIRGIFTIAIFILPLLMVAQSSSFESNLLAYIKIDQSPQPLNLDSVRKALVYPPAALKAEIEGTVYVLVKFDESGRYTDHSLLSAPHFLLTNEAEDKVRLLRFEPTIYEGRPVPNMAAVPFEFKLPATAIDPNHQAIGIATADSIAREIPPTALNMEELKKLIGYPPMAREAEIEGKVIIRVLVNAQGEYVKHIVIQDPHPILTKGVTNKISQLRFTPATLDGQPISIWINIPFIFQLKVPQKVFSSLGDALDYEDPSHVTELDLYGQGRTRFPTEVLYFTQLKRLELGDNQLTAIPATLQTLTQLQQLGLQSNQLTSLPTAVLEMPSLQYIYVSGNKFDKDTRKMLEATFGDKLYPKDSKGKVKW